MTFLDMLKVLVCFHYVFLYVSSQGGRRKRKRCGAEKMVEAGGEKKYRVGEVEIVSKNLYFFLLW